MTPELRQFLTDWLAWAEAGAPNTRFNRSFGLCGGCPRGAVEELKSMLLDDLGDAVAPFGRANYMARAETYSQHEDPARLAWVRGKLGLTTAPKIAG